MPGAPWPGAWPLLGTQKREISGSQQGGGGELVGPGRILLLCPALGGVEPGVSDRPRGGVPPSFLRSHWGKVPPACVQSPRTPCCGLRQLLTGIRFPSPAAGSASGEALLTPAWAQLRPSGAGADSQSSSHLGGRPGCPRRAEAERGVLPVSRPAPGSPGSSFSSDLLGTESAPHRRLLGCPPPRVGWSHRRAGEAASFRRPTAPISPRSRPSFILHEPRS